MSDSLNIKTFDLAAVLMGRSFPEAEAVFYLDEAGALKLARRERLITRYQLLKKDDEAAALAKEVEELKDQIRASRCVAHLVGVSNKTRQDLLKKATEKFPKERDFLGNVLDNDDRDELFTVLLWHAMLRTIEGPDGSQQLNFSVEDIQAFRGNLPMPAVQSIADAVQELSGGAAAGFESAVQEDDFLSQP